MISVPFERVRQRGPMISVLFTPDKPHFATQDGTA
jgi:hypothetical protein